MLTDIGCPQVGEGLNLSPRQDVCCFIEVVGMPHATIRVSMRNSQEFQESEDICENRYLCMPCHSKTIEGWTLLEEEGISAGQFSRANCYQQLVLLSQFHAVSQERCSSYAILSLCSAATVNSQQSRELHG